MSATAGPMLPVWGGPLCGEQRATPEGVTRLRYVYALPSRRWVRAPEGAVVTAGRRVATYVLGTVTVRGLGAPCWRFVGEAAAL